MTDIYLSSVGRSPVDSAVRHGDVLGEYDSCVTVWLVGGAVVHQGQPECHLIL